jgi:hypothetical protein
MYALFLNYIYKRLTYLLLSIFIKDHMFSQHNDGDKEVEARAISSETMQTLKKIANKISRTA